jgi:RNA recognition motif. (a.k.a. RRM, RBD, or RNP domain)
MSTEDEKKVPTMSTTEPIEEKKALAKAAASEEDTEDDTHSGDSNSIGTSATTDEEEDETDSKPPPPKKAKIAMPPPVASNLVDVDEYTLDEPLPTDSNQDDSRIDTPNIILFGLHPLVREPPLKKLCEHFGQVKTISVRSAFASRYGHVEFETVEEAKEAFRALNGAKLLHKALLVQPTKSSPVVA